MEGITAIKRALSSLKTVSAKLRTYDIAMNRKAPNNGGHHEVETSVIFGLGTCETKPDVDPRSLPSFAIPFSE